MYFTATFPYVLITILMVRAVTLPGASLGLEFYLKPVLSRLADAEVPNVLLTLELATINYNVIGQRDELGNHPLPLQLWIFQMVTHKCSDFCIQVAWGRSI